MSFDDFVGSLTEEQKAQLLNALAPKAKEEPVEQPNEKIVEDFTMHKDKGSNGVKDRRKQPVKAKANTWTDTGEHREVATPDVQRTPRNRPTPKKKDVLCNACGKTFKVNANIVYGEYYRCERCVGTR
jgi:formylmethanofuran dehydrogenase subunit E